MTETTSLAYYIEAESGSLLIHPSKSRWTARYPFQGFNDFFFKNRLENKLPDACLLFVDRAVELRAKNHLRIHPANMSGRAAKAKTPRIEIRRV